MSAPVQYQPGLVLIKPQYTYNVDVNTHPENVTWWVQRAPVSLSQANLQTIANTFDGLWSTMWKTIGASGYYYTGSVVQDFSNNYGLQWSTSPGYGGGAGANAEPLPANVAVLISFHTAERYRGGHGRVYLPWVGRSAQSSSDGDLLGSTFTASLNTNYGLIEPGMNGIAVGGGLSQRIYRQRTSAANAHLDPLSSYTVWSYFATQRRRLRKAAHH